MTCRVTHGGTNRDVNGDRQIRMKLTQILQQIDGQGYGTYRRVRGTHAFEDFQLAIDKVQVDPYAPPSLMRVIVKSDVVDLPAHLIDDVVGRIAVSDSLTRHCARAIREQASSSGEPGKASPGSIGTPGQQVLPRTSILIGRDTVEARIAVELPAAGRRIRGRLAADVLTEQLPRIVHASLKHQN